LIEQYQPEKTRLFDDPVAQVLVGEHLRFLMKFATMQKLTVKQTEAVARGIYGVQVCRTRYIDELLQTAITQEMKQVVIYDAHTIYLGRRDPVYFGRSCPSDLSFCRQIGTRQYPRIYLCFEKHYRTALGYSWSGSSERV